MAPYEPIYYAGYIQDKIEYRDLVVNLGVRVDVFDNNALTLRDPFSLFPITRAGEVGGAPSNIGSDYAVYYSTSGQVVGYRDLDGNFFDASGQNATAQAIRAAGSPQVKETRVTSEVFTDYDPEVTFQPRIGLSFPVTDQALFFASYNVISQRPTENRFDTPQQWRQASQQSKRNSNAGLRPEKTTTYELGFRQRLGARAALQISGFYKQIENLIGLRIVQNVVPNNYQTFENIDFGTVKGMEVEFDLRRTNNVSLNANYTLSFAQGTGSDASTTAQIVWRQESDPFYPTFISPLDFDQRHKANVTLDYRLGENEGPQILGGYPLSNFGVNIVGTFSTGLPYTRRVDVAPIYQAFNGFLVGELNGETQPSSSLVNLRVDRRFDLGGTNLVAYLWVQNLFDQNNVVDVYSRTGLADDDGWLDSSAGDDVVDAVEATGGATAAQSFRDHYRLAARDPFNYGIPRQIRLGVRVDF
jgi:outer membrane receptor protein involved in Fe transport